MSNLEERILEFRERDKDPYGWGWDGYHVEDVVNMARVFVDEIERLRAVLDAARKVVGDYSAGNPDCQCSTCDLHRAIRALDGEP